MNFTTCVLFSLCFVQTNPYYVKPRLADHQFGIKHYAGEVTGLVCELECVCVCLCVPVFVCVYTSRHLMVNSLVLAGSI